MGVFSPTIHIQGNFEISLILSLFLARSLLAWVLIEMRPLMFPTFHSPYPSLLPHTWSLHSFSLPVWLLEYLSLWSYLKFFLKDFLCRRGFLPELNMFSVGVIIINYILSLLTDLDQIPLPLQHCPWLSLCLISNFFAFVWLYNQILNYMILFLLAWDIYFIYEYIIEIIANTQGTLTVTKLFKWCLWYII